MTIKRRILEPQLYYQVLSPARPNITTGMLIVELYPPLPPITLFVIRLYLDAMALPRRFGKPDLFVTMTANPTWPEITASLPAGSHWQHHPDIVARVFLLKLNAMMDMIVSKSLFGKVLSHCMRIEWQVCVSQ